MSLPDAVRERRLRAAWEKSEAAKREGRKASREASLAAAEALQHGASVAEVARIVGVSRQALEVRMLRLGVRDCGCLYGKPHDCEDWPIPEEFAA